MKTSLAFWLLLGAFAAQPRGHVQLGTPSGGVSPEIARAAIEERLDDVRDCYSDALSRDERVAGRLAMTLTVRPNGTVSNVERDARSSVDEDRLTVCVQQSLVKAKLPARAAAARVTVPFDLSR